MADEEIRHDNKKQTAKFKGKIKSRWRKPEKIINMGNRERGHAFAEKRKKIALREYKKLLKKTREEHRPPQSSKKNDRPHLTDSSRVSDAASISEQDKVNNKGSSQNYLQGERKANQQGRQTNSQVIVSGVPSRPDKKGRDA